MKGLNRTKAPPMEEIEEYVKKVGMSHFQYVPGYKHGQFPLASKTVINRPASAVATAAGSVATDARKAGQRGGASAVGPGATATATSSNPPWWVYALVAVLGALGWELVTHRLVPARWLPWRARAA
jgi:hypothetical protein